jgi:GT2 family glycosyltransferase
LHFCKYVTQSERAKNAVEATKSPGTSIKWYRSAVTVAVLIVNWNGGDFLSRCLEALHRQATPPSRVIVVDNASSDSSLQQASELLARVEVIRLATNVGFARANNVAAAAAPDCDALALLNPDAFADPGWLAALVNAADREPGFSAFASQMRLASDPTVLDGAGDSYHVSGRAWRNGHGAPMASWPSEDVEVFAPCAAAALYRRAAFESVGGFDERYFCYFEDVDLGFRLRLKGHRTLYVHSAVVHHVSSGVGGYRSDFATYHGERNMVWTFFKDMPNPLFWRYLPQHIVLNLMSLAYYPLRKQGRVVLKAKLDALRGMPEALLQRRTIQRERRVDAEAIRNALEHGILSPYIRRYTASSRPTNTRRETISRADSSD